MTNLELSLQATNTCSTMVRKTTEKKLSEDIDWFIRNIESVKAQKEAGQDLCFVASMLVSELTSSLVTRIIQGQTEATMARQQEIMLQSIINQSKKEEQ